MITVLVVDPLRLYREGIRTLINTEPDMKVVEAVKNGELAIERVVSVKPDVVVMDVEMPGLDAIKTCSQIRDISPETSVIYLTQNNDIDIIYRGIVNGADGFLSKELFPDMLCQAIRDASRGQNVISGEIAKIIVNHIRKLSMSESQILEKRLEHKGIYLTKREMDIVQLILRRYTNNQISKYLHLTEGTVKNYISNIYLKIGINHRNKVITFLEDLL
ncbi:response regulator transcription factor [Paucisalibacillus sp. EB02]|uniref:response regulator n=1 Tax=Paucisalibacillus sp. EB02 TaxID=1347087 RepID=UPI0004BA95B1|nr:response regulator transcription factor [Paucisalibacillus sp. EB02]